MIPQMVDTYFSIVLFFFFISYIRGIGAAQFSKTVYPDNYHAEVLKAILPLLKSEENNFLD